MKKKQISLLLVLVMPMLVLCGCDASAKKADDISGEAELFVVVDRFIVYQGYDYVVLVNKKTRVMYLTQTKGGMTVMLNADGSPMLYEGEL